MSAIITYAESNVAYWAGASAQNTGRAFGFAGEFRKPQLRSFARLSAFAANSNHAPQNAEGAVTWDAGMDLLFKIAGRS